MGLFYEFHIIIFYIQNQDFCRVNSLDGSIGLTFYRQLSLPLSIGVFVKDGDAPMSQPYTPIELMTLIDDC